MQENERLRETSILIAQVEEALSDFSRESTLRGLHNLKGILGMVGFQGHQTQIHRLEDRVFKFEEKSLFDFEVRFIREELACLEMKLLGETNPSPSPSSDSVPVLSSFERFLKQVERRVDGLSLTLGKKIAFTFTDKRIQRDDFPSQGMKQEEEFLKQIQIPLIHLIQNACDHGIEMPEERRRLGKDEVGSISVQLFQEGQSIAVEIKDDGRGLSLDVILENAIASGVIAPSDQSRFLPEEIFNFIFLSGFSTAPRLTSLSGRGFGLDVVKNTIESCSGSLEISTRPNEGLSILMRIPIFRD